MTAACADCTRLSSDGVHPSMASSSAAISTTSCRVDQFRQPLLLPEGLSRSTCFT